MKKILSLTLAIVVILSLATFSTFAADNDGIVLDIATEATVIPGCEAGDDAVNVAGKGGAYSKIEDGKILMEANVNSTEQFPRPVIQLNKQVDANTYKWMIIEINYCEATLLNTVDNNNPTTTFTPFMAVGYVESDITTHPTAWVNVNSQAAALITTPETFEDDFTNKTFDINNVKEGTTTLLVQLPSSAAAGFNNYLNFIYFQPFGWGAACSSEATIEITSISFYATNPYAEDDNSDENGEDVGDVGGEDDGSSNENEGATGDANNDDATKNTETSVTTDATDTTGDAQSTGCGSVIGGSAIAVAAIVGTVVLIKKKED